MEHLPISHRETSPSSFHEPSHEHAHEPTHESFIAPFYRPFSVIETSTAHPLQKETLYPFFSDKPIICHTPALSDLAILFNRLLKFQYPVSRNHQTFVKFMIRHLYQPRLPKSRIEQLPVSVLEWLVYSLCTAIFPLSDPWIQTKNSLLILFILMEDMVQFQIEPWVRQDIILLGEARNIHPYGSHYPASDETISLKNLQDILQAHGYETTYLPDISESGSTNRSSRQEFLKGFLICRALTYPLPWIPFLTSAGEDLLLSQPALHRLRNVGYHLETHAPDFFSPTQSDFTDTRGKVFSSAYPQTIRPVRGIILVEGATEQNLIPRFAEQMGIDLVRLGVLIVPTGGKNQMVRLYRKYADQINGPVFIILDRDAEQTAETLKTGMRDQDRLWLLDEGELEDTYPWPIILKVINEHYNPPTPLTEENIYQMTVDRPLKNNVALLKQLWIRYELGNGTFDKVHFAQCMMTSLKETTDVPQTFQTILRSIAQELTP